MDDFRPTSWDAFVGQRTLKERLQIHADAAYLTDEPLPHLLLAGPPGVGKTTLGHLVAERVERPLVSYVMPVKLETLHRLVVKHRGVLFLDELHRAPQKLQEELLSLLEDGYMQMPNGGRLLAAGVTVIGATTEPEGIIPPLYDRFTIKPVFEPYSEQDMEAMVAGMAERISVTFDDEVTGGLARAACGVPRNARQLVLAASSLALTTDSYTIDDVLHLAGLTQDGLSDQHLQYVLALDQLGGRAGLAPLCTMLRLHPKVVQELERVLLEKEIITYRANGRELLSRGYELLAA